MSVFADLHVHTTNSDGELTLDELPAAARAADVGTVAVTDHDRLHPDLSTPVAVLDGVTVVHGIELRVAATAFRVDLLGYAVTPTPALSAEVERLQADRVERGRAIVDCVEDRLGVELDLTVREGIGRPHVARAIDAHPEVAYDFQGAFDHLIGDDGPCYVPRDVPSFERGVALLSDACGLVSLAHPFRYPDPAAALELAPALDAVERHYPYGRSVDVSALDRLIADHDLVPTGGSDAHGRELGLAGLDREEYRRFRSAIRL